MKQLIFNYVDPKVQAISVAFGDLTADGFNLLPFDDDFFDAFPEVSNILHREPIFGKLCYILPDEFDRVFDEVYPLADSVAYYPTLIALTFNSLSYGTKKEE